MWIKQILEKLKFEKRPFKVIVQGRAGLIYEENDKKITIDSELTGKPDGQTVFVDTIASWDPPYHEDEIPIDKRDQIIENIKNTLEKGGYKVLLIDRNEKKKHR